MGGGGGALLTVDKRDIAGAVSELSSGLYPDFMPTAVRKKEKYAANS